MLTPLSRRALLRGGLRAAAAATAAVLPRFSGLCAGGPAAGRRPPRILLRSSWQTVNIGDIAHTPGLLAVLERHVPEAEVRLWPSRVDNGVEEMLLKRFPKLGIVKGPEQVRRAFEECDFLLHGSGPSLVAQNDVHRWSAETGKPYGIAGITFSQQGSTATRPAGESEMERTLAVLSGARFVFFRDSVSLEFAKARGCAAPVMGFGPDAAFATDLLDEPAAEAFLARHGLEAGRFLCCIPRLRYTPYWTIPAKNAQPDPVKQARNDAMKEQDHEPLRRAMRAVLEGTDLKILLCPEDQTQMRVGKELLLDPLPAKWRSRVVWRPDYWLTAEALSTYRRSAGLFGNEMHSPILCVGSGVPAIVCRWAEQTSKGFMWRDIGLGDWLFDMDREADRERVAGAVLEMASQPDEAKARAARARDFVRARHAEMMSELSRHL